MGDEQFLMTGLYGRPGIVHADDELLAVVLQLFLGILVGQFLLLDGMRTAPPSADGNVDTGKEHAHAAVSVHQVVVAIAGTDAHLGQVLAYGYLMLQAMALYVLLQQAVLWSGCYGRLVVFLDG